MILAIDTSCYTTSIAICDLEGRLVWEKRRPLAVPLGSRGLRQSEALFQHVRSLPDLAEAACAEVKKSGRGLTAVAASSCPRPAEGSYMPVFLAGVSVARGLAAGLDLPCHLVSHQEGHIQAALSSVGLDWREPFLALHLSGGTGEILLARPTSSGYQLEQVGGCDLPPGQFIDRVGVALGLPFPAGSALEKLAAAAESREFRLTGWVQGGQISFSGPESAAQRAMAAQVPPAQIAAAVLDNIARSVEKAIRNLRRELGCERVLVSGGVAANSRLRQRLLPLGVSFGLPRFSGDNAYGVAALGAKAEKQRLAKS